MTPDIADPCVISADREIAAGAGTIFEPLDAGQTRVNHTYDWTALSDETRLVRARSTTAENLQASIDRLADLAEQSAGARTPGQG